MKTLPITDFLLACIVVCIFTYVKAASSIEFPVPVRAAESIIPKENVFRGKSEIIGNVNSTREINRNVAPQNSHNNSVVDNAVEPNINGNAATTAAGVIITTWIENQASSSSPPPLIRARTTKLLEKPLESQLISQFHESKENVSEDSSRNHVNFSTVAELPSSSTPSPSTTPLSPQSSFEKRQRLLRRKHTPGYVAVAPLPSLNVPTVVPLPISPNDNNKKRRQDTGEIPEFEGSPSSEIEFPSAVSPIESSLGGLTGLQGLPPLTPVQFVKLLVTVTPFIIPLIFIPLLIFTVGLSISRPVTRANVFVDVGDVRSPSTASSSLIPSFISSYVVNPIKTFSGGSGATTLMALPRSLAYDLGGKLVDTEQCVKRISCEISARYLHSHWEQGNWRTANTSWISRIMGYLGQRYTTVSRIAKSLQATEGSRIMAQDRGASDGG